MYKNPLTAIDFYKSDHRRQYPKGTTEIYSNLTPRSNTYSNLDTDEVIFFGLQYFLKDFLINAWNKNFFHKNKNKVIEYYKNRMDFALGKDSIETKHIENLRDLGYLPLRIKALPEGSSVPMGIPLLTITNTHPDFFWLTNYIETILLNYLWKPTTAATVAFEYKKLLDSYATKTGSTLDFIQFQAHDFSFRGLASYQDAAITGAAHLTSFYGTDTVPAIDLLEEYYDADPQKEVIGCSVPATEHSVMSMIGEKDEFKGIKYLINELYPKGIVSIVSDTWNLWKVITEYLVQLKKDILKRDGKLVVRPDSGDPIKILAGDSNDPINTPENKGVIECLWNIFGGTKTTKGYKLLDPHIGVIYGDSITLTIAKEVLKALELKGFASENIVFGVGAHTYQSMTRDSFSFAVKATSGVVNGERRIIFKDPKTDSGIKKSAQGLLRVELENNKYVLYEQQSKEQEKRGLLTTVFLDGKIIRTTSLSAIREKISNKLKQNIYC